MEWSSELMTMFANNFRREVVDPLYAIFRNSTKYNYWEKLEKSQYMPLEELKKIQWERLQDLLLFVYHHNKYYSKIFKDAGISPDDIKTIEDFKQIPFLTKNDIRKNENTLISNGFDKNELLEFKTGGSTGKSLKLFITEECSEMRNACARRHDRWSGWEVGDAIGAVWGNPPVTQKKIKKIRDWLLNPVIYLDTMALSEESVKQFALEWKKVKPTLLFGHAHSVFMLAQYIEKFGISEINPKAIISTSMMLMPNERMIIEDVFKTPVTDRYGCEEVSLIASQCELQKGYHLNIEHLIIEFIKEDGTEAKEGEMGEIVVTDLMNYAMPFIRYKVEDFGIPTNKMCECGRGLPLMEKVVGRRADFLIKQDGTRVAGISLIENTLTKISGIEQMQIIQNTLKNFTIYVVVSNNYSDSEEKELLSFFKQVFGETVSINVKKVNEIKREKNGKYRFSINYC